jgi:cold shock CspA family protein
MKDDFMKIIGSLNVWFADRNYGFIHEQNGGVVLKHFLHGVNIKSGTPKTGATVSFRSIVGSKGFVAVEAEILGGGAK